MSAIENALRPFHNEAQILAAEGLTLRLVVNFRMIDLLECLLGKSMDELLPEVMVLRPPNGLVGKFIWAMTREHHPDLTLDQIAGFLYSKEYGPAAGAVIGDLLQRAFNIGEDAEGEQGSRPPKRRPPKRSGGASKRSSRSGSPPA